MEMQIKNVHPCSPEFRPRRQNQGLQPGLAFSIFYRSTPPIFNIFVKKLVENDEIFVSKSNILKTLQEAAQYLGTGMPAVEFSGRDQTESDSVTSLNLFPA